MWLRVVAGVSISDLYMGSCQGVAMQLPRFSYVVAMGLWVVARVFVWLLVCCAWFL